MFKIETVNSRARLNVMKQLDEVLTKLEKIVEKYYSDKDIDMFYADYRRRVELLIEVTSRAQPSTKILDAGGAPGFTSLALKLLGYEVILLDIDPEPYCDILQSYGIKVVRADLEHDIIPLNSEDIDVIIFTEVLEHLSPYYISWALSELNRVLKYQGLLFLSTPNIASIGKRVKLLLGKNPLGPMHVKEYTIDEVRKLLNTHGFEIIYGKYSMAYDKTPYHAKGRDHLLNLVKATAKYPTKENMFKLLSYPLVKICPSLRATILCYARKVGSTKPHIITRRF